jgi:peptide chain release factor
MSVNGLIVVQLDGISNPGLSKSEMKKARHLERERRRRKKAKKARSRAEEEG